MHNLSFSEMVLFTGVILLVLFFLGPKPRKPPRFPRHPIPSDESLHPFLGIQRRRWYE
jgi:hypothetical protein